MTQLIFLFFWLRQFSWQLRRGRACFTSLRARWRVDGAKAFSLRSARSAAAWYMSLRPLRVVSIILAKSAVAFATVKYLGAGYLCFLGVRMILDARRDEPVSLADLQRRRSPFWQGIMTEALNPKTALFFLSFIPQFVNRGSGHVFLQFVLLGTFSVALNTSADIVVTLLAGPLGERIRSSARFRRRQRTLTGAIMIGLGGYLALGESK